jgi:hypothetical protein
MLADHALKYFPRIDRWTAEMLAVLAATAAISFSPFPYTKVAWD